MTRAFPPLLADHWMVTDETVRCAICHERFQPGEVTTAIPVELPKRAAVVEALPAHVACLEALHDKSSEPSDD